MKLMPPLRRLNLLIRLLIWLLSLLQGRRSAQLPITSQNLWSNLQTLPSLHRWLKQMRRRNLLHPGPLLPRPIAGNFQ